MFICVWSFVNWFNKEQHGKYASNLGRKIIFVIISVLPNPNLLHSVLFVPKKKMLCSMLRRTESPPATGGGPTFYYTSHIMKRFILHDYHKRPWNGFENWFEIG